MKSDVPLLVHLGLLELDVGAVEPVPEAEPPVAGVKPVEDQTVVTLTSYSCTIHRYYVKAGGDDLSKKMPLLDNFTLVSGQSNVSQFPNFYLSNNLPTLLLPTSYLKIPRPTNLKHKFRHEFVVEKF